VFLNILCLWIVAQMLYFGEFGPDLGPLSFIRPDRALFVLLVAAFIRLALKKELNFARLTKAEYLMVAVALLCTISLIVFKGNDDETTGKNKWLNALFNITYYPFITYFMVRSLPYRREALVRILWLLCLLGIYLSWTGIFEHFQVKALVWPRYILDPSLGTHFERSRGPFMESVAMGRVLTITFAAFLVVAVELQGVGRSLVRLFAILSLVAVYYTYTRGPWLGLALVLGVFLFCRTRLRSTARTIMIVLSISALIGIGSKFSLTQGTLFSQRQNTVEDRMVSYLTTIKILEAHPILGIGFGRFGQVWDDYYAEVGSQEFGGFDGSHNTFLTMAAEGGIFTLLLYIAMLCSLTLMCQGMYQRIPEAQALERCFVLMVIGIAAMYALTGFFSDLRWNLLQNDLMFLLFGLVAGMARIHAVQASSLPEAERAEEVGEFTRGYSQAPGPAREKAHS
jgi:O-antigen ligase